MCLSIEGTLDPRNKKSLKHFWPGLTAPQAKNLLKGYLAEGKKVLPFGEPCEGFSYETGCPGHLQIEETRNAT
jgi:hypothetical protein